MTSKSKQSLTDAPNRDWFDAYWQTFVYRFDPIPKDFNPKFGLGFRCVALCDEANPRHQISDWDMFEPLVHGLLFTHGLKDEDVLRCLHEPDLLGDHKSLFGSYTWDMIFSADDPKLADNFCRFAEMCYQAAHKYTTGVLVSPLYIKAKLCSKI